MGEDEVPFEVVVYTSPVLYSVFYGGLLPLSIIV